MVSISTKNDLRKNECTGRDTKQDTKRNSKRPSTTKYVRKLVVFVKVEVKTGRVCLW